MAHHNNGFASSAANTPDSEAQQLETDPADPRDLREPWHLYGPVSQPGRGGLLRRIELRVGSVS